MSRKLKIAIISIYPFPIGMAASNRILAYSKGFVENGGEVDVFITLPLHRINSEPKQEDFGNYCGINYQYTSGRYSHRLKIIRALSILSGYRFIKAILGTSKIIHKKNIVNKYDCMIISSDKIIQLFSYSKLAKLLKIKSIFIFDEYPTPIRGRLKEKIPFYKSYLYRYILKDINAYISISEKLARYFNEFCQKKTLILPVITDTSRFVFEQNQNIVTKICTDYICYMGNLELTKDNVDIIIKSFSIVQDKFPEIELHIYGSQNEDAQKYLSQLSEELGVSNKVLFKGRVSSEFVPQILMNSKVLVSSQPNSLRASGGFPTKLGEYLASGVPAIFTDVGENSKYVLNNVHAYFVEPDNHIKYAEKIIYILENYETAKKVATNGRNFILDNYSHITMGKKLKSFIESII